MPSPTRDEVAKRAGVSTATVSRVLNHRGSARVSAGLQARVLAAAEEIGYHPNGVARALATGRTHVVALWAADCFTPFYAMVGRYIAQQGVKRHYQVMVNSLLHYSGYQDHTAPFFPWHVDGVLACDVRERNIVPLDRGDIPLVSLGVFHDDAQDFVEVDLYGGTLQAIQHLLRPGIRRVAYMLNAEAGRGHDPRTRAYEKVMQEAGLGPETITLPNQQRPLARQAIKEHVCAHGLPEAIFCINDDVAIGCYRGLRDLGVRIPEDIALVGCDGLPELEYLETPISTIVYPLERMCQQAWDFFERRIQEPETPAQQTVVPSELVIRASSCR